MAGNYFDPVSIVQGIPNCIPRCIVNHLTNYNKGLTEERLKC